MTNIILNQCTFPDGTSCPVSLKINDEIYNYGETDLFEKLSPYKNAKIIVNYNGYINETKTYLLGDIILGKIPTIRLDEIKGEL